MAWQTLKLKERKVETRRVALLSVPLVTVTFAYRRGNRSVPKNFDLFILKVLKSSLKSSQLPIDQSEHSKSEMQNLFGQ